jgi:hypothetical protein
MKKIFVIMFAGLTAISAQAQLFIGGSLGIDYGATEKKVESTNTKGPSLLYGEISPMLGFHLSDNIAVGIRGGFGMGILDSREDKPRKVTITQWGASPFVRFALVKAGDLSFLLEGGVPISGAITKTSYDGKSENGPSAFGFGATIMPVLSYGVTDNLSFELRPNLLRLGFEQVTITSKNAVEIKTVETYTAFGFGINSSVNPIKAEMSQAYGVPIMLIPPIEIGMVFNF